MYSNTVTDMSLTGIGGHRTSTPYPTDTRFVSTERRLNRLEGMSFAPCELEMCEEGAVGGHRAGSGIPEGNGAFDRRESRQVVSPIHGRTGLEGACLNGGFRGEDREGPSNVPNTGFSNGCDGKMNEASRKSQLKHEQVFTKQRDTFPGSQNDFCYENDFVFPQSNATKPKVRINEGLDSNFPRSQVGPLVKREPVSIEHSVRKPIIRPQNYSGSKSWHEYLQHFENCARINGWDDQDKLMFLSASLVDLATSVLVGTQYHSFRALCEALERRFGPAQATLCKSELRARRQRRGECFQGLAEDIRRLTILAYPDLPEVAWQNMACEAFIDAISSDEVRRFVLQSLPSDLLSAVTAARQYEAIKARERDRKLEVPVQIRSVGSPSEQDGLYQAITTLTKQVDSLRVNQSQLLAKVEQLQGNRNVPAQVYQSQPNIERPFIPNYGYQNDAYRQARQNSTGPPQFHGNFNQSQAQGGQAGPQQMYRNPVQKHNRCFLCNEEGHFKRDCPLNAGWRGGMTNQLERH